MDKYTALYSLGSIISFLGTFIIFIAGIIILIRKRTTGSILVFIGGLLLMLMSVFGIIGPMIAARRGSEEILWVNGFLSVARGFSFLILSIGVLALILNIKKSA